MTSEPRHVVVPPDAGAVACTWQGPAPGGLAGDSGATYHGGDVDDG